MMTGTVTISVEIELGWGFHDKKDPRDVPELSDDGHKEREALDWFLSVCDEAGVPVTFDIVGHLLLESCDGNHDGPHTDGWFERDPGTDAETDPLFYFPEAVDMIRDAEVDHEIATHTFSHVLCNEIEPEVLDWELEKAGDLQENVVSLVPPRHQKPDYEVLTRNGIDVVRAAIDQYPPSNLIGRYLWTFTREHPLDDPRVVDGIVETYTSPLMTLTAPSLSKGVSKPHFSYRLIPLKMRQKFQEDFLISGLEDVLNSDAKIHYWTHLYNLANQKQRSPVRRFVEVLSESRVDVITMAKMND